VFRLSAGLAAGAASLALLAVRPTPAVAQDRPVALGGDQNLEDLTGENSRPLQITGFGVGTFHLDARTHDNTFQAGKVALSAFREINDHIWYFGQLTTTLEQGDAGGDVATSTEIDNLLVNFVLPGTSNVSLSFGKLDAPLGFERDDEPLNLQASTSYNYELGRPGKFVGLVGRWAMSPKADLTGVISNGWDSQVDPNHGKTGMLRLGLLPSANSSLGVSGVYGVEGDQGDTHNRYLMNVDYAFQPNPGLIIAGEANLGGDRNVLEDGSTATWKGALLTVFSRLERRFGLTFRAEVFDDPDGVRSGLAQTLQSYTVAPVFFLGSGREGIFANVEHTTFRIPRFQLRAELRLNHSSELAFPTSGDALSNDGLEFGLQLVTVF
jgi:Putative beta-barrel porin-2, OmpL-like. bbp2